MDLRETEARLMQQLMDSLRVAITSPETRWESASPKDAMTHFTGRAPKNSAPFDGWTIQLVCLGDQRMGASTSGTFIVKLTDELAALAEQHARAFFERHSPGDIRNGGAQS